MGTARSPLRTAFALKTARPLRCSDYQVKMAAPSPWYKGLRKNSVSNYYFRAKYFYTNKVHFFCINNGDFIGTAHARATISSCLFVLRSPGYKFLTGLEIKTKKQTNKQKIKDRRLKERIILENITSNLVYRITIICWYFRKTEK